MAFDKFSLCPCGSGKKAKFCCSKDLVSELDKIIRAISGEQRAAAFDQLNRSLAKHPDAPCLLALKGNVLIELGEWELLGETVGLFLGRPKP